MMRYIVPCDDRVRTIPLGRVGENNYTEIAFDISAWQAELEISAVILIMQRATDTDPYPATITIDGQYAVHLLTSTDLRDIGNGKCQLQILAGDVENPTIAKSKVYNTVCLVSLGDAEEPPEPWQPWMTTFEQYAAAAIEAAGDASGFAIRAEDAASEARGYAGDAEESAQEAAQKATEAVEQKFGDLTAEAEGLPEGSDPTASYDDETNKLSFGIPKGDTGEAATVEVGATTTLAPGSNATVENVGTEHAAIFNFGIPKGETGNVYYAAFAIDISTGVLSMVYDQNYTGADFQINAEGILEVII